MLVSSWAMLPQQQKIKRERNWTTKLITGYIQVKVTGSRVYDVGFFG